MALKDNSATTNPSATIDAITKFLLTEMRRLGDRIEARCARIEHNICPALTASASATIYDESNFFDEQAIFFDERPIFDKEPVFAEESVFDTKPVFDEETSYSAAADGVGVVCFDEGPIFDEEPDDFTTAVCGVVLFDGPDVSTGMIGHNSTASPRHALRTSSINKEFILDSDIAAMAFTAMAIVSSNINADAPTSCSTKCPSVIVDITASTELGAAKELVLIPAHAAATPTAITAMPSNANTGAPTKCLMKCPGHTTGAVIHDSFPDFTPAILLDITLLDVNLQNLKLLNSEALLYASLSAHKVESGKYTERQPWPPPTQL